MMVAPFRSSLDHSTPSNDGLSVELKNVVRWSAGDGAWSGLVQNLASEVPMTTPVRSTASSFAAERFEPEKSVFTMTQLLRSAFVRVQFVSVTWERLESEKSVP